MDSQQHIIVADDDRIIHVILARLLARALPSATVSFVNNGVEALALYHQQGADLVLADCFMPEMSGLVLALRLREENPALTIVLMSSGEKFAAQAKMVGATAFVLKHPAQEIVATVARLLQ